MGIAKKNLSLRSFGKMLIYYGKLRFATVANHDFLSFYK